MIDFEWGTRKAATNLRKHGIRFEEAQSVFYDECTSRRLGGDVQVTLCHCQEDGCNAKGVFTYSEMWSWWDNVVGLLSTVI